MTSWSPVFLGTIALATFVIAAVQIGVIVYIGRLARRVDRLACRVEEDFKPILDRLNDMTGDAARVTSLAVAQVERADQLFANFAQRADHIMSTVQNTLVIPVRESVALFRGLWAGLGALRRFEESQKPRPSQDVEDEEALFIG